MAQLKRVKFGKKSEQLVAEQKALFNEAVNADIAAIEAQLAEPKAASQKPVGPGRPKRAALPENLPRVGRHHESDTTTCTCGCQLKRIGEDVSEKLNYAPAVPHLGTSARVDRRSSTCVGRPLTFHVATLLESAVPSVIIGTYGVEHDGNDTAGCMAVV